MKVLLALLCCVVVTSAASTGGFRLATGGSITSNPAEVVSGTRSVKGSGVGFQNILSTDTSLVPFLRNRTYRVTFRYKILSAGQSFGVTFYSGTAAAQNVQTPSQQIVGSVGTIGSFNWTATLGPYDDFSLFWNMQGPGAIAIDDIQITAADTGALLAAEDAEPGTYLLSTFFVSASKQAFVFGELIKVTAGSYDENGNPLPTGPVTWTTIPPSAASVAPDGTVTARALNTFSVRAAAPAGSGTVFMQALPKRIVVTPEKATMTVGSTQKMRADALDINGQPIPNTGPIAWSVSSNGIFDSSPSASIDSSGTLKAIMQAKVRVVASLNFSQSLPDFNLQSQGETMVDITAPISYRFERVYVARASGAATSTLAPRASPLVPTASGGFMFAASLDGLGNALLEWNNGALTPLLTSGRVNLASGFPLAEFVNYARTRSGAVLVQEADSSNGNLVSLGPPSLITPVFSNGAALFGAQSTNTFEVNRNSLAESGYLLVRVTYTDAVTHKFTHGLFRGFGRGVSEPVITEVDSLLANQGNGAIYSWGVANDGAAWFEAGQSVWRSAPGQQPQKILSPGDAIGNEQFGGYLSSYSLTAPPMTFVASNGDFVEGIYTDKGPRFVLWHENGSTPALTLPASGVNAVHWYEPGVGVVIEASFQGKPRGLYLWNASGTTPLLMLNDSSLDGSPVQEILSATVSSDGTVYAMVRTGGSQMLIACVSPNPQVLIKAGDALPVNVPPVITRLIPGARTGVPAVIAGAQAGSIAQLDLSGVITPIVAFGTVLPDGKTFAGSLPYMVRTTTDGSVIFSSNYAGTDSSLYTWNQGTISVTVPAPYTVPNGNKQGWPKNMEVNRQGDVAFQLTWGAGGPFLFRIRSGAMAVAPATPVDGVAIGGVTIRSIDEGGNVLFTGTNPDGTGFYAAAWDGSTTHLILSPGLKLPDGRSLSSVGNWAGCGDGLVLSASNFGVYARYRNGAWDYLAPPATPLATGAPANQLGPYNFDANRNCDVVFQNGAGNTDIGAFAAGQYREIQDLARFTPDGDLLIVSQLLINDDGTVYVLGGNDQGQQVLYRATPLQ